MLVVYKTKIHSLKYYLSMFDSRVRFGTNSIGHLLAASVNILETTFPVVAQITSQLSVTSEI